MCTYTSAADSLVAGYNDFAKRWRPILDAFDQLGVDFALEVHPTGTGGLSKQAHPREN
jgi:hypothetical protein